MLFYLFCQNMEILSANDIYIYSNTWSINGITQFIAMRYFNVKIEKPYLIR